ncbi:hypothetical protein FOA52_000533 [Chlamydomonas sp. UWO 241]|nr:hypothetical protein FOA52_000533 [Chlamydomonas sp. UWO 241]
MLPLLGPPGLPPKKKRSVLHIICPFILSNEFCERLAFYGLATNLVTYITTMIGGQASTAAIMVSIFIGACYTTPLIGAVLADSVWGRYKTIVVFSCIYLLGISVLTLSTVVARTAPGEKASWGAYAWLYSGLGLIALGTGGIKPNVSAFGADQFNLASAQDRREKESFFNYFYMVINFGSLIAVTTIVYVQDQVSWTLGFAIPGVAMLAAICVFTAGSPVYVHVPPTESPVMRVGKVVYAALHNRWKKKHASPDSTVGTASPDSDNSLRAGTVRESAAATANGTGGAGSSSMAAASFARLTARNLDLPVATTSMSHRWLEDAITEWQTSQGEYIHMEGLAGYSPQQVEEVKLVLRLLPVFFSSILYWTIYTQMSAMFVNQGNLMARAVGVAGRTVTVPAASMVGLRQASTRCAQDWRFGVVDHSALSTMALFLAFGAGFGSHGAGFPVEWHQEIDWTS